jgi:hypothetical protein
MKIFKALGSGFKRSSASWKGIMITWFILLLMVAFIALPVKSILRGGVGHSLITERLSGGLDIEALTDLGPAFSAAMHSFTSGLMLLFLAGIIVNAFLTGGLFDSMKNSENKFSFQVFFASSARNFLPFLLITLIVGVILLVLGILLVGLPLQSLLSPGPGDEKTQALTRTILITLYGLITVFFLLVADYARAWQVKNEKAGFRALGYGFSQAFGKCISSWPMMLLLFILQIIVVFLTIKIIGYMKPTTGTGVLGMFLLSQLLFIIRVFVKTWRYGSVISLSELNAKKQPEDTFTQSQT